MDLFNSGRPNTRQIAKIKSWAQQELHLSDEVTVMVTELRCSEPGCPPIETVIAILGPTGNQQFKLHKRAEDVTRADIAALR